MTKLQHPKGNSGGKRPRRWHRWSSQGARWERAWKRLEKKL